MRKELVLGMTAKELVEVINEASMRETIELKRLIDLHPNAKEIHTEIAKEMIIELAESAVGDEFGTLFEDMVKSLNASIEKENLAKNLREQLAAKETPSLKEVLEKQITQQDLKAQIQEQLKETHEMKDTDDAIQKIRVELRDFLQKHLKNESSVTEEDVLNEVVERIYAIETNDEEMVLTAPAALYHIGFSGHFDTVCEQFNVDFEYKPEYTTVILRKVTDLLIEEGRSIKINIVDGEVEVSII